MKTLLCLVLLASVAACHSAPPTPAPTPRPVTSSSPTGVGATSARAAVEQFFAAVRAQDLQAMAVIWGTNKGPARDNIERTELEKREIILQCYFAHDSYQITGESGGMNGQQVFRVTVTRGQQSRYPAVYTVQGPGGRWFVQDLDIAAVRDFCGGAKR